jgi:hypothetical protein
MQDVRTGFGRAHVRVDGIVNWSAYPGGDAADFVLDYGETRSKYSMRRCPSRREVDARRKGREALEQLERALGDLAVACSTTAWLSAGAGLDRERSAPNPVLLGPATSARWSANSDRVPTPELLRWVAELLDEPERSGRSRRSRCRVS